MGWLAIWFEDGGGAALTPAGAVSCGIESLYVDGLAICTEYFDVDHPRRAEQLADCAPNVGDPEPRAMLPVHRADGAIDPAPVNHPSHDARLPLARNPR